MQTVLYIGTFKFGKKDAESHLVLGNGRVLRKLGYNVVYIGNEAQGGSFADISSTKKNVDGFDVYDIQFKKGFRDLVSVFSVDRQIKSIAQSYVNLKMVICYGTPTFAVQLLLLSIWCKRKHIAFISNCVELSSLAHGSLFQRVAKHVDWALRYWIFRHQADGIIAISTFIADFYQRGKKKSIVIIPPLKDTESIIIPELRTSGEIRFLYAGVPFPTDGRKVDESAYKDRLDLVIEMLCKLKTEYTAFHLDIYGIDENQYLHVVSKQKGLIENNRDIITFHGRVSHEKVLQAERTADYTLLFRVKNRMTMAGFSTKLVESISCGVPVITTDTSNYKSYIIDGVHGFFVDIENPEKVMGVLRKVLTIDRASLNIMKTSCYESKLFDYRNFTEPMREFIGAVLHDSEKS